MLARLEDDIFFGLERGRYAAIVVDPPWHFKSRTALQFRNWNSARDVEKHYRTMSLAQITALPVGELAARNAHLFLCATGPCLPQALEVMRAWGFKYSSMGFTWIKLRRSYNRAQVHVVASNEAELHVGLGLTTRKNAEFVLLGRRGNARRCAKDVREVILSPVREHSRKPAELFDRVTRYCAGPYLELFAREARPGWTVWGDEVGKFEVAV